MATVELIDRQQEQRLLAEINQKLAAVDNAIKDYVEACIKLEVRKSRTSGIEFDWFSSIRPDKFPTTVLIMSFINSKTSKGARLKEMHKHLNQIGKNIQRDSLTAMLNKLKRDGKIFRKPGGYWKSAEFPS